jgi:glycosyltransferase involved in cell wall biosynthesis
VARPGFSHCERGRRSFLGTARRGRPRRSFVIVRTCFVSTYPPRRCGIATFTSDLGAATHPREIAALHPEGQTGPYPVEVRHRIRKDERADYFATANALNRSVDVVSVQHEYGIWGGDDGEYVLDFVRALRVPVVATLHTVLRDPSPHQRSVLSELVDVAQTSVVMSRSASELLIQRYDVDARRLAIIPHGVPNVPLVESAGLKPGLGMDGRDVILSFGLLGPGKGYELAIDALPAVVAEHPDVLYVILGATHPDLIRREGEAYRQSLVEQIRRLDLERHVLFVDRFVGRVELIRWLEAADVFVTPYPNLGQIVSGTLSYAMGAGRAIVSTPYTYAAELLSDGRGVLVPPGSASALAEGLNSVLEDAELRTAIGRRAYAYSRRMIWPAVGTEYGALFASLAHRPASERSESERAVSRPGRVPVLA